MGRLGCRAGLEAGGLEAGGLEAGHLVLQTRALKDELPAVREFQVSEPVLLPLVLRHHPAALAFHGPFFVAVSVSRQLLDLAGDAGLGGRTQFGPRSLAARRRLPAGPFLYLALPFQELMELVNQKPHLVEGAVDQRDERWNS